MCQNEPVTSRTDFPNFKLLTSLLLRISHPPAVRPAPSDIQGRPRPSPARVCASSVGGALKGGKPYALVGFSFGAVLAYEVGKTLAAAAMKLELHKTAVLSLELAYKQCPEDKDIGLRLGEALVATRNTGRAQKILKELNQEPFQHSDVQTGRFAELRLASL